MLLSSQASIGMLLLVGDGRGRAIKFRDGYRELLVIGRGLVLQDAEGKGLTQDQRLIAVASVVDAGMDAVAEGDVVPEFVQLSVDGQRAAGERREALAARGRHHRVGDHEAAVKKEFQHGNAGSAYGAVTGGVRGMRG